MLENYIFFSFFLSAFHKLHKQGLCDKVLKLSSDHVFSLFLRVFFSICISKGLIIWTYPWENESHYGNQKQPNSEKKNVTWCPGSAAGPMSVTRVSRHQGTYSPNHSQQHSLSFSPRFANWNVAQMLIG